MNVEWNAEANRDLDRVVEYMQQHHPGREAEAVLTLIEAVELLATQPAMGRAGRVARTREWVGVEPWLVVYKVERSSLLVVVRVLHTRERWPSGDQQPSGKRRR